MATVTASGGHTEDDAESYFTAIPDVNHHRLGFKNANVSKCLLFGTIVVTVVVKFLQPNQRLNFFICPNNDQFTYLPYLLSAFRIDGAWNLFGHVLLLFCFRSIERHWGSAKFVVFILWTYLVSLFLMVIWLSWYSSGSLATRCLPGGLISPLFALFVCESITNLSEENTANSSLTSLAFSKTFLISMTCLQILTSNQFTMFQGLIGLILGVLHRLNLFYIQSLGIPSVFRTMFSKFLRISTSKHGSCAIGSTPETHDDMVYDFVLQNRRSFSSRNQPSGIVSNILPVRALRRLTGLLGRQRNNTANRTVRGEAAVISEDKISRLSDMGFTRLAALQALERVDGDVQSATELLLSRQAF